MNELEWRKSSHSGINGCVEVAWHKSSYSCANGCVEVAWRKSSDSNMNGNCVEVLIDEDTVLVRDSKWNGGGPVLTFTKTEWRAFLGGVHNGEFDG